MKDSKTSNNDKPADNAGGSSKNKGKQADGKKRSALSVILIAVLLVIAVLLLYLIRCQDEPPVVEPSVPVDTVEIEDTVSVDTSEIVTPNPDSLFCAGREDFEFCMDSLYCARTDDFRHCMDSLSRIRGWGSGYCDGGELRCTGGISSLTGVLTGSAAPLALRRRQRADSLARLRADSLARLKHIEDSLARLRAIEDSLARLRAIEDSLARLRDSLARLKALEDSLARARFVEDSLSRVVDPCARDTLQPWVYADPSGGLHRRAVSVKLIANKICKIEWRLGGSGDWKVYDGTPIDISTETILQYRAQDSCGKRMDVRSKRYVFDLTDRSSQCPQDMEYIKVGEREFCIDVYEWPNRRNVRPNAFVSMFQAMDSCFSVRKRLCTSDEWTTACAGPENWMYTYGNNYEGATCVARDTLPLRSGSRPECRGYFGVFDMSGNLAEWTSTPSPHDRSFNNVMGGFWMSGTQSRCADARYSYFPQNRHNPVGFRCCRDAGPEQQQRQRGGGRN